MQKLPKHALVGADCVACGCCALVCPKNAIQIRAGVTAQVNISACVGCGKCAAACPAAVIHIAERRADA